MKKQIHLFQADFNWNKSPKEKNKLFVSLDGKEFIGLNGDYDKISMIEYDTIKTFFKKKESKSNKRIYYSENIRFSKDWLKQTCRLTNIKERVIN